MEDVLKKLLKPVALAGLFAAVALMPAVAAEGDPDTTPPTVTCTVDKDTLWPPNHKFHNVGLHVQASDDQDESPTITVEVYSDEDDLSTGSGNASPDARDIAPETLNLRAERSGNGTGRVYLIIVTATDDSGNSSHDCCVVVVPHDHSPASLAAAKAEGDAAHTYCETTGQPPAGYFEVGDGPVVGNQKAQNPNAGPKK